jgi:tRNA nucleotidyltransferase (CCA-adding enzyme)
LSNARVYTTVITSHQSVDFDGVASACAARHLYPGAVCVSIGKPDSRVLEFIRLHPELLELVPVEEIDLDAVRHLVVVDTSSPDRLGLLRPLLHRRDIQVDIFDHHAPSAESVQADRSHIQMVGAAVTVVLEQVFQCQPRPLLSPSEATLYLTAIYEKTGSFRYRSTSPADLRTAAVLMEAGANLALTHQFQVQPLRPHQMQILDQVAHHGATVTRQGRSVFWSMVTLDEYCEDLSVIAGRLRDLLDVNAVLLGFVLKDHLQWIARSSDPALDVGRLFRGLGGGGHAGAASASQVYPSSISGEQLATELLDSAIPLPTARDLMTSDCERIDWDDNLTVLSTYLRLRDRGQRAAVMFKQDAPWGLITAPELSKALHHGMGDSHIKRFCHHPLPSVEPQQQLPEIQRLMVEHDLEWLPVVEESQLLGWIARPDLLRQLYSQEAPRNSSGRPAPDQAAPKVLDGFSPRIRELLGSLGELAERRGERIYLVGGLVRDRLSGRDAFEDLDCVLEGAGIEFSQEFASQAGASELRQHTKFGTSQVCFEDGISIDIATARREVYCRAAALPAVEDSHLKQDLFRRDFSINAIAVALNPRYWGKLVDPWGGARDLQERRLRVLHSHSFFDDPTRMLRAVRFEQRLQFQLGPSTLHQIEQAASELVLLRLSPERVRKEIQHCCSEVSALSILWRLGELSIFEWRWPTCAKTSAQQQKLWHSIGPAMAELKSLGLLFEPAQVIESIWLECQSNQLRTWMGLPESHPDQISRIIWKLSPEGVPASLIHSLLQGLTQSQLVWLSCLIPFQKKDASQADRSLRLFLNRLRTIQPLVTGKLLCQLGYQPGPQFKPLLDQAFEAQLDSNWSSLDEATDWLGNLGRSPVA